MKKIHVRTSSFPNCLYRNKNADEYGKCQRFEKKKGVTFVPKKSAFSYKKGCF